MLSHFMIGSNDLERAAKFYDATLGALGAKQFMKTETRVGYRGDSGPAVMLCPPFDGKAATVGNGSMPCFSAPSADAVQAFHKAALAHGGVDEGAPGKRGDAERGPYLAYVRDPDGNKIGAIFRG